MLLDHGLALLHRESSKREHANLVRHMLPAALGADVLQVLPEQVSHLGDAVRHRHQLGKPLGAHIRLVKNDRGDGSAVSRGRRVSCSDDDLDL